MIQKPEFALAFVLYTPQMIQHHHIRPRHSTISKFAATQGFGGTAYGG